MVLEQINRKFYNKKIFYRLAQGLFAKFRGIKPDQFPKKTCKDNYVENCALSEAFALSSMITTISMGLCGFKEAFYNAFIRSNALSACQ